MNRHRLNVLHIGSAPIPKGCFDERGLMLIPVPLEQVQVGANSARGLIIAEPPGKLGLVQSNLTAVVATAEDYGLSVAILVNSDEEFVVVEKVVADLGLARRTRLRFLDDVRHAAEFIRNWDPGPELGSPELLNPNILKDTRKLFLLGRCFGDCKSLYLEALTGGKDSLDVFCVHARLRKSPVGPRPLPYFIKFSSFAKIEKERAKYRDYAEGFIPFYLRPNLVPERCADIRGLAALVGNFVEDSIPLRTSLRTGQCPGIIFSLFENSLKGFRFQPPDEPTIPREGLLEDFASRRAKTSQIESGTIRIARRLGLTSAPSEIEKKLCAALKGVRRRFNPFHGDLHTGNIRVRGNDAVLIDLSAVKDGPLTADPAALEVSLVFGTDSQDRPGLFDVWKKAVDDMYRGLPIHQPPSLETGPGPFSWLYRAVREVRHVLLGCDCNHEEAAGMLAVYLLRLSRLPVDEFDNPKLNRLARFRRGYALVIAERIVNGLPLRTNTIQ